MEKTLSKYELHILRKLHRHGNYGEDYLNTHDLVQGLAPHERDWSKITKAAKNLLKLDLIEQHKNGQCISIKRGKLEEVENILEEDIC